jgi:hypothetical protein
MAYFNIRITMLAKRTISIFTIILCYVQAFAQEQPVDSLKTDSVKHALAASALANSTATQYDIADLAKTILHKKQNKAAKKNQALPLYPIFLPTPPFVFKLGSKPLQEEN